MGGVFSRSWPWITALVIGCFFLILRGISVGNVQGPIVYGDEFIYWRNMLYLCTGEGTYNSGYPPLYPAWMALGHFWTDHYRGILLLNVLLGATLPLVAWRISGKLPSTWRITGVALLSLSPFFLVYPRMMMSENLFIPLLGMAFLALFIFFRNQSLLSLLAAGMILWLACMTRYQGLFFVFAASSTLFCLGCWIWKKGKEGFLNPPSPTRLIAGAILTAGLPAAGILLWKAVGIPGTWGAASTVSYIYRHDFQLTPGLVALWGVFYLSYLVLAALPLLAPLIFLGWTAFRDRKRDPAAIALFLFMAIATGTSFLVAVRHSALVDYNHPDPSHIMGRYLVFFPILALLSIFILPGLRRSWLRSERKVYLLLWIGCSAAGILAYGTIIQRWFITIPSWFVMSHTGLDAFGYREHPMMLVIALALGLLVLIPQRVYFLAGTALFFLFAGVSAREGLLNNADGPEAFSEILQKALDEYPDGMVGAKSNAWFKADHIRYYLGFKGIPTDRLKIGEGWENEQVEAVIKIEPKPDPDRAALFTAGNGMAIYLERRGGKIESPRTD